MSADLAESLTNQQLVLPPGAAAINSAGEPITATLTVLLFAPLAGVVEPEAATTFISGNLSAATLDVSTSLVSTPVKESEESNKERATRTTVVSCDCAAESPAESLKERSLGTATALSMDISSTVTIISTRENPLDFRQILSFKILLGNILSSVRMRSIFACNGDCTNVSVTLGLVLVSTMREEIRL